VLTLYHNALSTCSQKVQTALTYKNLEWESRSIDLRGGENFSEAYRKINPKTVVPVLVHDDRRIFESTVIMEYLDDTFPEQPFRPDEPYDCAQMRLWTKRVDEDLHSAVGIVTLASVFRAAQLQNSRADVLAEIERIPSSESRKLRLAIYERGIEAPEFQAAFRAIQTLIGDMADTLRRETWLAGPAYSIADAAVAPYILRLQHLHLESIWSGDDASGVADWFDGVARQPAFQNGVTANIPPEAERIFDIGAKELESLRIKTPRNRRV